MSYRRFGLCNKVELAPDACLGELGRRDFLFRLGGGVGSLALSSLLFQDGVFAAEEAADPLAPKTPPLPSKAKSCIFLFMYGGPSQMDTFDPKPTLARYHGRAVTRIDEGSSQNLIYVGSPFKFAKHGQCGTEVSEIFPHLATCVDDMAVVRSLHTDNSAHPNAVLQMNLGLPFPGGPSMGAWVVYGLGTVNQNLPAFVVFADAQIYSGSINWSNGYLPGVYQGTLLNSVGTPIVDLQPPQGVTAEQQKASIELLNQWNRAYTDSNPDNGALLARMKNYELAFRMQAAVPEALRLAEEPAKTQELYGVNDKITEPMGRKCLMARRLVERGVRFVQIYSHGWDHHEYLAQDLRKRADETDRPIAALLKDLKQRGLLDQTLVVWGGEFGRTADNAMESFRSQPGRDHNKKVMVMWFAGGGIKGGTVLGSTDELGMNIAESPYHLHDMHATILRLMGLDDMRLTYYHGGRFKRLTDLGGRTSKEIVA
jgi:hypothetical protein